MEGPDQANRCAICLGSMRAGDVQATFTAEGSHTFHFSCISTSVAHGNLVCPLCNAQWRDLPFVRPTPMPQPIPAPPPLPPQWRNHRVRVYPVMMAQPVPAPPPQRRNHYVDPVVVAAVPQPVPAPPPQPPQWRNHHFRPARRRVSGAATNRAVVVKTHTECSAVTRDSSSDNFAVLVHLKAPGMVGTYAAPRAALDLVTVLDVSGSMSGRKLALLKQAMRFVIDNLGPNDRLSVVSFSSKARRVIRLTCMTKAGKASCVRAVESLSASVRTNIAEGLRTAAKVLAERRQRNAVSSVLLLSDTYTMVAQRDGGANYEALVPSSFLRTGGEWSAPIHTFGFGNDHDSAAMHVIADATGGTFSFIEDEGAIQDAFAQCIGGLISVVVQEARIAVACAHPGVRVVSVKSGRYQSRVDLEGRAASVQVGELYADEERRFLLFLAVPKAQESDNNNTALMKVVFSYRNAATGLDISLAAEDVVVARPEHAVDAERSVEVAQERVRVEAAEDIAAARAAAERGAYQEAVEILENRQREVAQSGHGDAVIVTLGAELQEMRGHVSSQQNYARSGRAYMLAGMNAHAQQRATSRQMLPQEEPSFTSLAIPAAAWSTERVPTSTLSYATPAMRAMLMRSQRAREASSEQEQQQPKAAGEDSEPV